MGLAHLNDFTLPALMHEIDELLKQFVYNGYNSLSSYLATPLMILSAIFIVVLGYSIMQGWVEMNIGTFSKTLVKLAMILTLVTNWGFFNEYVVNTVYALNNGIASAIVNAGLPVNIPPVGGIDEALNTVLLTIYNLGKVLWKAGGLHAISFYFEAVFVWSIGSLMGIFALFEIILSKVMLAVLLMFAPIVIPFAYFRPSSKITDNWTGLIIAMLFLQFFVMIALAFAITIYTWLTAGIVAIHNVSINDISLWGVLALCVVGIMNVFLVLRASRFAYGLAGQGSITASSGEAVAGMAGFLMGGAATARFLGDKTGVTEFSKKYGKKVGKLAGRYTVGLAYRGAKAGTKAGARKVKSWWK